MWQLSGSEAVVVGFQSKPWVGCWIFLRVISSYEGERPLDRDPLVDGRRLEDHVARPAAGLGQELLQRVRRLRGAKVIDRPGPRLPEHAEVARLGGDDHLQGFLALITRVTLWELKRKPSFRETDVE